MARELGVAPPCAAQLPYSLIARDWVESAEMTDALLACGAKVVASYVLAGGILSGKYASGAGGRMAGEVDAPRWEGAVRAARELAGPRGGRRHDARHAGVAFALAQRRRRHRPLRRHEPRADPRERRGRRRRRGAHREPARAAARDRSLIDMDSQLLPFVGTAVVIALTLGADTALVVRNCSRSPPPRRSRGCRSTRRSCRAPATSCAARRYAGRWTAPPAWSSSGSGCAWRRRGADRRHQREREQRDGQRAGDERRALERVERDGVRAHAQRHGGDDGGARTEGARAAPTRAGRRARAPRRGAGRRRPATSTARPPGSRRGRLTGSASRARGPRSPRRPRRRRRAARSRPAARAARRAPRTERGSSPRSSARWARTWRRPARRQPVLDARLRQHVLERPAWSRRCPPAGRRRPAPASRGRARARRRRTAGRRTCRAACRTRWARTLISKCTPGRSSATKPCSMAASRSCPAGTSRASTPTTIRPSRQAKAASSGRLRRTATTAPG